MTVGDDGSIATSVDRGSRWTVGAAATAADLRGVAFSGKSGWSVGTGGTVLAQLPMPAPAGTCRRAAQATDLSTVAALGPAQAWVGGGDVWGDQDAVLLHTTDGARPGSK